jgi:hypothetical protein
MITVCSLFLIGGLQAGTKVIEKTDKMNASLFEAVNQ